MSTLSLQKRNKLNQLLREWPAGTIATQVWLEKRGVSRQLSHSYKERAWIDSIGQGAFIRAGDKVDWKGGLYSLQHQLNLNLHLGGLSALELQGKSHFVPLGKEKILHLYSSAKGQKKQRLPAWFLNGFENTTAHYHPRLLFSKPIGFREWEESNFSFKVSSAERAVMEILAELPQTMSYTHAFLLCQRNVTLRPRLIQQLLECCLSYKVKRLFLHFATKCNMPWLERLELGKVDLGRGKRQIESGGVYDNQFKIAIPKLSPFDDPNVNIEV